MKSWKDLVFLIVMFLILVLCVGGCCYGCHGCFHRSSSSDSSDTTKSAFYKRQRGEKLTEKENKELESYDKWEEKQEDKDK